MKRVLATVLLSGGLFYSNAYAFLFQQILEETTDRRSFAIRVFSEKLSAANGITAAAEDAVNVLLSTATTMDDVINCVPEDSASVFERTWGNIKASNAFPLNWNRMFLGSLLGGGSKMREVSYLGYMH
ncbi:MAG: hypothetical protein LBF57_02490, partial [Holosporaceae bacterium]|nr:hypothetical protein [Holosporaceae bacterium]